MKMIVSCNAKNRPLLVASLLLLMLGLGACATTSRESFTKRIRKNMNPRYYYEKKFSVVWNNLDEITRQQVDRFAKYVPIDQLPSDGEFNLTNVVDTLKAFTEAELPAGEPLSESYELLWKEPLAAMNVLYEALGKLVKRSGHADTKLEITRRRILSANAAKLLRVETLNMPSTIPFNSIEGSHSSLNNFADRFEQNNQCGKKIIFRVDAEVLRSCARQALRLTVEDDYSNQMRLSQGLVDRSLMEVLGEQMRVECRVNRSALGPALWLFNAGYEPKLHEDAMNSVLMAKACDVFLELNLRKEAKDWVRDSGEHLKVMYSAQEAEPLPPPPPSMSFFGNH